MKILLVCMPSVHVYRWISHLDETYELYWFDVTNRKEFKSNNVKQKITNWKRRKLPYVKGEYTLSKKMPKVYEWIQPFLEVTASEALCDVIEKLQPDIVHSFEMQSCTYPILKAMKKYSQLRWIYSCWGSDLYYYKNFPLEKKRICKVLNRVDILHTDNLRDQTIAKQLGFKGYCSPVIPGGGGYAIEELDKYRQDYNLRKIIAVKGYQHKFGRGLLVVKALEMVYNKLPKDIEIHVFGAHNEVIGYIEKHKLPFFYYHRHELVPDEVLQLFGKSLLYIGNSVSDGMPNTLLEAMLMGALPIQSNPGGVTEELIVHGENGFLIKNPNDVNDIVRCLEEFLEIYKVNYKIEKEIYKLLNYKSVKSKIESLYLNEVEKRKEYT